MAHLQNLFLVLGFMSAEYLAKPVTPFDPSVQRNMAMINNETHDYGKTDFRISSSIFSTSPTYNKIHAGITGEGIASEAPLVYNHTLNWSDPRASPPTPDQYGHLLFNTDNFTHCFLSEAGQYLNSGIYLSTTVSSGEFYYDGKSGEKVRKRRCKLDVSVPKDMIFKFQVLSAQASCTEASFRVTRIVSFNRDDLFDSCYWNKYRGVNIRTFVFKKIRIIFSIYSNSKNHYLHMNFTAVPYSERPKLELITVTEQKGYVTSPGWDGSMKYPFKINLMMHIKVPAQHQIMLSFPYLDMTPGNYYSDFVSIMTNGNSTKHREYMITGKRPPKPSLHDAEIIYIHMVSKNKEQGTGFKLLFSFHSNTTSPQQLTQATWNCSVSYWSEFKEHFPCNLLPNCAGGEDEENCTYSSPLCGVGYFIVANSCYAYIETDTKISWDTAVAQCQLRGDHLISLNDDTEWKTIITLLKNYHFNSFYTGLHFAPDSLPHMYSDTFHLSDGTVAYFHGVMIDHIDTSFCTKIDFYDISTKGKTGFYSVTPLLSQWCQHKNEIDYVCERPIESVRKQPVEFPTTGGRAGPPKSHRLVSCPAGQLTLKFLACDLQSQCWVDDLESMLSCQPPFSPRPPMFECANNVERVPYTLVCDHRSDCSDYSDEDFCVFQPCSVTSFYCGDRQCIPEDLRCDKFEQCVSGADELRCDRIGSDKYQMFKVFVSPFPPALVNFDGAGSFKFSPLDNSTECPETHFSCPGPRYYCMPVYVRCNDVNDCPGHEDETACDTFTCPGYYRCRNSHICLHLDHLCDGVFQCPQHEDELYCHLICPHQCICYGYSFFCSARVELDMYSELRFLAARGSGLTPIELTNNTVLIYLDLASCGLLHLELPVLNNLNSLDISDNFITSVNSTHLNQIPRLRRLILAGNPVGFQFFIDRSFPSLYTLDLSHIPVYSLNVSIFMVFPNLRKVNLSETGVKRVLGKGFQPLRKLRELDIRGCPMTHFPRDVFKGLDDLWAVRSDNYKICCSVTLPEGFNLKNCLAPFDEVSSCQTLLRSNAYRVLLAIFGVLALTCNAVSFVFRIIAKALAKSGFGVFVIHLCVSDFLMGVYLAVIGVADRLYLGNYLWKDTEWRHSATCHMAGFFSLLSSEVSAFLICLITLDRFLVLRFPFSHVHFHSKSAHVACATVWCLGLILAAIPLLPATSHWEYYSQTGICIPLPITRREFAGQKYSFTIMIILNFVLFLLIAVGQLIIYLSIRANTLSTVDVNRKAKDHKIARRLITIAMSDFLCWFPIGLLGLLAAKDIAIPGEVNVSMSILVLPLNSALNPFLYTLNLILERRQREKEDQLHKRLVSQLQSRAAAVPAASAAIDKLKMIYSAQEVRNLLEKWLHDGVLSTEHLHTLAQNKCISPDD